MKKTIAILFLIMSAAGVCSAQTSTVHGGRIFLGDVFLSDDLSTPLRDRIPSGAVISGVINQDSNTASFIRSNSNAVLSVFNWSAVDPTQDVSVLSYSIIGDTASYGSVNESGISAQNDVRISGSGSGNINLTNAQQNLIRASILSDLNVAGAFNQITAESLNWGSGSGVMEVSGSHNDISLTTRAGGKALTVGGSAITIRGISESGPLSTITNLASGSMWIGSLVNGETVYISGDAKGSLNIGNVINTNRNSLAVSGWITAGAVNAPIFGSIANASGTPAHIADRAEFHTNALRYTSSPITDSADAGAPHQFTHTSVNGTNYLAFFSMKSNEWYFIEMKTSAEHGF